MFVQHVHEEFPESSHSCGIKTLTSLHFVTKQQLINISGLHHNLTNMYTKALQADQKAR